MRDVNYILRKAYYTAISGLSIECYYQQAPQSAGDNYVIIKSISNIDNSTKSTVDINASIQITVYTKSFKSNTGKDAEDIANDILQTIYPTPDYNISVDDSDVQVVRTEMVNDITNDYNAKDGYIFIDRTITFRHNIFIKN